MAYAALGSNLGDRMGALVRARQWIRQVADRGELRESRIYETLPVGPPGQDCHLNQVVSFATHLTAEQLLVFFKEVERWLGRQPRPRMHAREIDIDLLFHGAERIELPHLQVPHPRWLMRSFVLVPLLDLDPDFIDPGTGIPAAALLAANCPGWESEAWIHGRPQPIPA